MKGMRDLLGAIQSRQFAPLYLLGGEEPYHLDVLSDAIEAHAMEEHERDFNQTILYGRDSDLDQVLAAARQFPMMAERRLVLVKEAQDLREWKSKDKLEKLAAYADNPVASTVLVLVHRNKMPDKRLSAVKRIQKAGVVFQSDKVRDYKLAEWIEGYVASRKRQIHPRTAQLLAEYLGNDLKKIAGEMDKLFIALPEGGGERRPHRAAHRHFQGVQHLRVDQSARRQGHRPGDPHRPVHAGQREEPPGAAHPADADQLLRAGADVPSPAEPRPFGCGLGAARPPLCGQRVCPGGPELPGRKVSRIFGYLRECDARSKGIDNATVAPYDLLEEALFKTLH